MELNSSNYDDIRTSFFTAFNKGLNQLAPQYVRYNFALTVQAKGVKGQYPSMESWPGLRRWEGDKQIKNVRAGKYEIENYLWEDSLHVHKIDLMRDSWGSYTAQFEAMGQAAAQHADYLLFYALDHGYATKGQDGKNFFATDHVGASGGTQKNFITSALSASSYASARALMRSFTDINGNKLDCIPSLLVVSPNEEKIALEIIKAGLISSSDNVWKGSCDLLVTPWVTSPRWYLLDTTKPIKPLIYQEEFAANMNATTDPNDSKVNETGYFLYSMEASHNTGYGAWQLAVGSSGST